MTHFWEPRTTTTCLSVKEMLAQTQTRRGNRCRRFRTLLTYSSFVMNSFKGGSDPHWGHGECVPARQPGDAEPGRQHHPPHRLRPLWHSQRLNRAGHPVAPGDLFNVGCTLYAPLWLHFIFFFGLHSSTAGVLWATAWTAEASDKSDQVCGENWAQRLALFPKVLFQEHSNALCDSPISSDKKDESCEGFIDGDIIESFLDLDRWLLNIFDNPIQSEHLSLLQCGCSLHNAHPII